MHLLSEFTLIIIQFLLYIQGSLTILIALFELSNVISSKTIDTVLFCMSVVLYEIECNSTNGGGTAAVKLSIQFVFYALPDCS